MYSLKQLSYYFEQSEKFAFPELLEDINEPWELLARIKPFLNERLGDRQEIYGELKGREPSIYGGCYIGRRSVIYNDVTIIGPVYIGENCEIMPGAVIRPYTVMSDGSSVGHGSEVKRGLLFSGAKVASLSFVGDSILGASARIGSGVITANRKFNQSNVTVRIEDDRVDLQDDFFGLVLGDCSRIGANSVSQPGTHIGPYTWIYPMTGVRGFIPGEKRVYNEEKLCFEDNERLELKK